MPSESREITFSELEMRAAVIDYCLRHDVPLPEAGIKEMKAEDGGEGVHVSITYMAPAENSTVTLNQAEIGAALIFNCLANKIPLPRASQKSLRAEHEGITLLIRISSTS